MPGAYDTGRTSKGQAKSGMGGKLGGYTAANRTRLSDTCSKTGISKSAGNVRGSATDQTGKKMPSARKASRMAKGY